MPDRRGSAPRCEKGRGATRPFSGVSPIREERGLDTPHASYLERKDPTSLRGSAIPPAPCSSTGPIVGGEACAARALEVNDVASFRIVCTEQVPSGNHSNGRIVAVGTGADPDRATHRLTVPEVITAMGRGDTFYTKGKASGRVAWVEKYWCHSCSAWHIRTRPDVVTDNNLDSLRACSWQS